MSVIINPRHTANNSYVINMLEEEVSPTCRYVIQSGFRVENAHDYSVGNRCYTVTSCNCPEITGSTIYVRGDSSQMSFCLPSALFDSTDSERRWNAIHKYVVPAFRALRMHCRSLGGELYFITPSGKTCYIEDVLPQPRCGDCNCILESRDSHLCPECRAQYGVCVISGTPTKNKFGGVFVESNLLVSRSICEHCAAPPFTEVVSVAVGNVTNDYHDRSSTVYMKLCEKHFIKWLHSDRRPIQFNREYSYSFKKTLNVQFLKNGELYVSQTNTENIHRNKVVRKLPLLGFEWEVCFPQYSNRYMSIRNILKSLGDISEGSWYFKHDGTIPDPGSELVSCPMTLGAWKKWYAKIKKVFKYLNTDNMTPDKVGGHIHINRSSFTTGHLYKFMRIVNHYPKFMEQFCGRSATSYTKQSSSDGDSVQRAIRTKKGNINSDRYEIINITRGTLELRGFASPTTSLQLYANLEFMDALWNFTLNAPLRCTLEEFVAYVFTHTKAYVNLASVLKQMNIDYTVKEEPKKQRPALRCIHCGVAYADHEDQDQWAFMGEHSATCPACRVWCVCCDEDCSEDYYRVVVNRAGDTEFYCSSCYPEVAHYCGCCEEYIHEDIWNNDANSCDNCAHEILEERARQERDRLAEEAEPDDDDEFLVEPTF